MSPQPANRLPLELSPTGEVRRKRMLGELQSAMRDLKRRRRTRRLAMASGGVGLMLLLAGLLGQFALPGRSTQFELAKAPPVPSPASQGHGDLSAIQDDQDQVPSRVNFELIDDDQLISLLADTGQPFARIDGQIVLISAKKTGW
jgi:hypothetical protein